jgi:hypothetical protein
MSEDRVADIEQLIKVAHERREIVAGLHARADWLAANPGVPVDVYSATVETFNLELDEIAAVVRATGTIVYRSWRRAASNEQPLRAAVRSVNAYQRGTAIAAKCSIREARRRTANVLRDCMAQRHFEPLDIERANIVHLEAAQSALNLAYLMLEELQ